MHPHTEDPAILLTLLPDSAQQLRVSDFVVSDKAQQTAPFNTPSPRRLRAFNLCETSSSSLRPGPATANLYPVVFRPGRLRLGSCGLVMFEPSVIRIAASKCRTVEARLLTTKKCNTCAEQVQRLRRSEYPVAVRVTACGCSFFKKMPVTIQKDTGRVGR